MTRVIKGIYDDVVLDDGFFLPDEQVDILCEWLESYADALERSWVKKGSVGEEKKQKHVKVRSFIRAVERGRKGQESTQEKGKANG